MALNSILSSDYSEQRWVDQISKNFDDEVAIDIKDVPVSIFNVPKSISGFKPEAYLPQCIALGPYHHMEPHLYQMERYKIASVKAFLKPHQVLSFQASVIERLKEIEPTIRACYHKYLDLDEDTLAWIVAIDGLFLLDLLGNYYCVDVVPENTNPNPRLVIPRKLMNAATLVRDVMVLENQIPFVILKEIRRSLHMSSMVDDESDTELFLMLKGFCEAHSPLKLTQEYSSCLRTSHFHLLDLMYHLIINNSCSINYSQSPRAIFPMEELPHLRKAGNDKEELVDNIEEVLEMGLKLGRGKKGVPKPIGVISNVPWEKITNLLGFKVGGNHHEDDDEYSRVEEVMIPSVTSLCKYGRVTFSHTTGGIKDVNFVIGKEATLYLPVITLDVNSEVILRNLVAYEAATSGSSFELAQYVDLMSGIIDTEEDVKLLKVKGIIKGDLPNKEITELFNGINKSTGYVSNKTIEKINEYYNNRPMIKAFRSVKKRVFGSWKVLTIISTIVLCLLMILYSFCEVYGCPSFFHRSS